MDSFLDFLKYLLLFLKGSLWCHQSTFHCWDWGSSVTNYQKGREQCSLKAKEKERKRVLCSEAQRQQTHRFAQQLHSGGLPFDGILDDLNLRGHGGQHGLLQTVELVKASPGSALDQPHKDAPHGLDINALVAVEDQYLPSKETPQGLDRLCFPCAGWAIWVTTKTHAHTCEGAWK